MKILLCMLFISTSLNEIIIGNKPVIIIHGIAGIQMEAKLNKKSSPHIYCPRVRDWYLTWLIVFENILEIDCFIDNFNMRFDEETESMINQEGVEIRPLGPFGSVEGVAHLNPSLPIITAYFDKLIGVLSTKFGYVNMKDMFALGFDFRDIGDIRKMSIYFDSVTKFIENTFKSSCKRVIFVSHSMGGPLIAHFLKTKTNSWKDQYIDSWYSINGALAGSSKGPISTLIGDTFSIPSYITSYIKYRTLIVTQPSVYFLFPSSKIFDHKKVLIVYNNTQYNVDQIREFVPSVTNINMSKVMKNIPDVFVDTSPNVFMACVYGKGIPTANKIVFGTNSFDDNYTQSFGDGDGTVDIESLTSCRKWKEHNSKDIEITEFENSTHAGILQDLSFLMHFEKFIRNRNLSDNNKKVLTSLS